MPRLRVLEVLNQEAGRPSVDALTPLWAAPWFSQLHELSLTTDQGFGSRGLAPLRAAPLLQKLSLGRRALTAAAGRALAAAALPALRELKLHSVRPGLVEALAAAPWLGQLESLDISGGYERPARTLAAADGRALAAAPFPSLKRLRLSIVEPGCIAACAAAAWLSRLECCSLDGENGFLDCGGRLREGSSDWAATHFTALVSLTLDYEATALASEVSRFATLVATPCLGRLQSHLAPLASGLSWQL
jgi:hypothetical protein